jgi:NADH dehydrogenase
MAVVNIPETDLPRIVIVGAGFAGLTLARKLVKKKFQVVIFDKNNYHQFQPLLYQVAMSGLEPSSISFPLRKAFQNYQNMHIRIAEVKEIQPDQKRIITDIGYCHYDKLVIATGADTNYFGNMQIAQNTYSIKSVSEAMYLRNQILSDFELAIITRDFDERQIFLDTVIVGGGPTGVELAGALAEMKTYILPKDYPELRAEEIDIYLIQGTDQLLQGMSANAGAAAEKFLTGMGVKVIKNAIVTDVRDNMVYLNNGQTIQAGKVIWAAGVKAKVIPGLEGSVLDKSGRYIVDRQHRVSGCEHIYAIGDVAIIRTEKYPNGHPQVAQAAMQQATHLAGLLISGKHTDFEYVDKGSMATIGRNKAVADIARLHLSGFFAWVMWLFVHLLYIIGVKNRFFVFMNWVWNYFTYDQSLRLILRAQRKS